MLNMKSAIRDFPYELHWQCLSIELSEKSKTTVWEGLWTVCLIAVKEIDEGVTQWKLWYYDGEMSRGSLQII